MYCGRDYNGWRGPISLDDEGWRIVSAQKLKISKLLEVRVDRGATKAEAETARRLANALEEKIKTYVPIESKPIVDERYLEYRKIWFGWHGYSVAA
jgi:hypothetical protein